MIWDVIESLRDQIHSLVPPDKREEVGSRPSARSLRLAQAILDWLKENAVGREQAAPCKKIANGLGLYEGKTEKEMGSKIRGLCLLKVREGYPICGVTGKRGLPRGIYLATTQEEIDETAVYMATMALGTLNSAFALRGCRPFAPDDQPLLPLAQAVRP
jgi:hypothetical protein